MFHVSFHLIIGEMKLELLGINAPFHNSSILTFLHCNYGRTNPMKL